MASATKVYILFALNFAISFGQAIDYCSIDLCKPSRKHIACENDGEMSPDCADYSEIIELPEEIKMGIVHQHNVFRNKLALGDLPDFESATHMATMQWDDELAYLAELNLKSCTGTHDLCHNTYNFTYSGQNIAKRTTNEDTLTFEQLEYNMYHGIDRWFQEHEVCPRYEDLTVYTSSKKVCGHFTVMISERNTHVGCAIMLMRRKQTVFTCNYACTNMKDRQLYTPGKPTMECQTGPNEEFPGLCSLSEFY